MHARKIAFAAAATAFLVTGNFALLAQEYPSKSIRIVTGEAGGSNDYAARLLATGVVGPLGQPVIVDNRTGGVIAVEIVSKAQPDGYTLLMFNNSMWTVPLMQHMSYDPVKSFTPITLAVSAPNILVVTPSLPVKSVRDLIAMARAKPGELNYASGSTGGSAHLAGELFKNMTGTSIVRVPYKGGAAANIDLISGQVQMMFATAGSAMPHVKTGKLRALAVTSGGPSALAPGLPPVASELPGYVSVAPFAVFAPAGTRPAVVQRLNNEMVRVLERPEVKEKFLALGVEVVASTPEQLGTFIKSEMTRLGKVIKDAAIKIE